MSLSEMIGKESDEDFEKRMGLTRNEIRRHGGICMEKQDYQNLIKYPETARKILEDIASRTNLYPVLNLPESEQHIQKILKEGKKGCFSITHFKLAPWKEQLRIRRQTNPAEVYELIGSTKNPFMELVDEEILFGVAKLKYHLFNEIIICKYNGIDSPKFENLVYWSAPDK